MIKTIIFDFGDVFINLNKEGAMQKALQLFKIEKLSDSHIAANESYEQGFMSTDAFIACYMEKFPDISREDIIEAWNYILIDFPKYRFDFIKKLAQEKKYELILLSNTNELHINWVKKNVLFYEEFKSFFKAFYLSHEIQLRKPNENIFEFVLKENNLVAKECLFIDDTAENTDTASRLNINVWNNNPKTEDITDLFSIKKDLF